ncbi:MAG: O-antigen ligase family protein [Candidatus Pacebacteria bacterium]|nr:O-antigen ligase family protein [Candidatus Paceibacterota bacterium]
MTEYSFYSGAFTEYATFFVYASDVLLILTLFFWLVFSKKLHEHFSIKSLKNIRKLPTIWILLFIFIIWLIISALVNNNHTEISVFYVFKFIEFSLLIIYIYFNLRNKKRLTTALFTISLTGFFQGLIAIYQFTSQSPLFKHPLLHRLTGESTVYPQVAGIAKIVVDNEKLVRAYGTFPHPNLLGSFLIVSILISIYLLLRHKNYILSRLGFKYNDTNNSKSQVKTSSLFLSLFWIIFIFTQITALFFTFSRTAWMGFLISLFIIIVFYFYDRKIVSRETIEKDSLAKFVTVSLSNYDKFSVLPTLRQAQGDMLRFINDRRSKQNLNNKIVSRETIEIVYFTFTKTIRKILSIETYWIPASAGMTKDKGVLNKLKHKLKNKLNNNKNNIIKQKELFTIFLLIILLIISYFPALESRFNDNLVNKSFYLLDNSALSDRSFYNNVSRETISDNFIFGSGSGTSVFQINSYLNKNNIYQKLEPWQYQPAHNIYLLIASEIGIIGFVIFALFIVKIILYNFKIIKKPLNKHFLLNNNINNSPIVSRETIEKDSLAKFVTVSLSNYDKFSVLPTLRQAQGDNVVKSRNLLSHYLLAILISFLFIGVFDHYFWTLQQGRLIFWLILGLMLVSDRNKWRN